MFYMFDTQTNSRPRYCVQWALRTNGLIIWNIWLSVHVVKWQLCFYDLDLSHSLQLQSMNKGRMGSCHILISILVLQPAPYFSGTKVPEKNFDPHNQTEGGHSTSHLWTFFYTFLIIWHTKALNALFCFV